MTLIGLQQGFPGAQAALEYLRRYIDEFGSNLTDDRHRRSGWAIENAAGSSPPTTPSASPGPSPTPPAAPEPPPPPALQVPGPPSSLTARVDGTTVHLSWLAPTAGGSPTGYVLDAGTAPGDVSWSSESGLSTTLAVPNVLPGTYYVRIRAVNASGSGTPSNEVSATVPAQVGQTCSALVTRVNVSSVITGHYAHLSWTTSATQPGVTPSSNFILEAGQVPGASDLAVFPLGQALTFGTSVSSGTYYARIRASDPCGNGPASNEIVIRVP